jgi:hypothetical protein
MKLKYRPGRRIIPRGSCHTQSREFVRRQRNLDSFTSGTWNWGVRRAGERSEHVPGPLVRALRQTAPLHSLIQGSITRVCTTFCYLLFPLPMHSCYTCGYHCNRETCNAHKHLLCILSSLKTLEVTRTGRSNVVNWLYIGIAFKRLLVRAVVDFISRELVHIM